MSEKSKDKIPAGKRATRKKPKDKPKRPLSAYNYFFKEEREKILKILTAEDPLKVEQDPEAQDYLSEAQIGSLRKEGNKVSFEQMGKIIGARWKNIDPDRLAKFSELASEDTERYKKEMQSYNGRQEAKMRSEALKPQAYHQGAAAGARRADMSGAVATSQDPRNQQQPYPEMNPGYGYAAAYGQSAYDAYGYSMYGYASPAGYGYPPPMGGSPEQVGAYGAAAATGADPYARQMADQYQMAGYPAYSDQGYPPQHMDPYGAQAGYPQQGGWGGQ